MNEYSETTFEPDFLENLYNHTAICEALLHEGHLVARLLLQKQIYQLFSPDRNTPVPCETACIYISTLNHSLYNYISFHLNLSAVRCCYESRIHIYKLTNVEAVLNAGEAIINSYAAFLGQNRTSGHQIDEICMFIQKNLDQDLSISQICRQFYISKNVLCNTFRELTGNTMGEYIKQQRLQHARRLLASTSLDITEISEQCGFRSPTYFSTVFKQEMGISPSLFRQTLHT